MLNYKQVIDKCKGDKGNEQSKDVPSSWGGGYLRPNFLQLTQRVATATLSIAAFLILSATITNQFHSTHADGLENTFAISNAAGSLSISSITDTTCANYNVANSTLSLSTTGNSIVADCITYLASTDNDYGYTLTINGPATGNLSTSDNLSHITSTTGIIIAPATFATQTSGGAWGFAIPSGQMHDVPNGFDATYQVLGSTNRTNTARYAAVPTSPTIFSQTTTANTTDDQYNIFFAAAIGTTMPTDEYSGTIVISGTLNDAPIAQIGDYLQTITAANCPTERTRAVDARDGNTYWVRRIGDLCWMETNLAYAGGGTNTYGDALPTFTLGNSHTTSTQACYGNNATMAANPTAMCYWTPLNANPTSGTTDPSLATDGGIGINNTTADTRPTSTRAQFGYIYSWCTAMAGQSAACQTTTATQPDPSVSICPAGWRLPTGQATTGEFTLLNNTLNSGSTSSPSGLFTNGLYMYAGAFVDGSFNNQGSNSGYWASTVDGVNTAFRLYFTSADVNPARSANKGYGTAVRCVAP